MGAQVAAAGVTVRYLSAASVVNRALGAANVGSSAVELQSIEEGEYETLVVRSGEVDLVRCPVDRDHVRLRFNVDAVLALFDIAIAVGGDGDALHGSVVLLVEW